MVRQGYPQSIRWDYSEIIQGMIYVAWKKNREREGVDGGVMERKREERRDRNRKRKI